MSLYMLDIFYGNTFYELLCLLSQHIPPGFLIELQAWVSSQINVVKESPVAGTKGFRVKCAKIAVTQEDPGLKIMKANKLVIQ